MAKKIDYDFLADFVTTNIGAHPQATEIVVPMKIAVDICFAMDRLRKIQEDIEGKFQEI